MPRQPRYDLPGFPQHVIQRGKQQAVLFDVSDYGRYLEDLHEVAETTGCLVHAFMMTTSHVDAQRLARLCLRQRG